MKTARTRKVQTNKTNYMSDEAFADLKEALEDALAFERSKRRELKVTRNQAPRPPKAMSPIAVLVRIVSRKATSRPRTVALLRNTLAERPRTRNTFTGLVASAAGWSMTLVLVMVDGEKERDRL